MAVDWLLLVTAAAKARTHTLKVRPNSMKYSFGRKYSLEIARHVIVRLPSACGSMHVDRLLRAGRRQRVGAGGVSLYGISERRRGTAARGIEHREPVRDV